MKKPRSAQEQAVAVSRVRAATQLQEHRPRAHQDQTKYNRTKAKRLWQKDQEALHSLAMLSGYRLISQ